MFMVLKEDIQNVLFKCEKILEVDEIKLKRLKKEYKMLSKVMKDYELSDDNSIVYNEICTRHINVVTEIEKSKNESKSVRKVISKIIPLLTTMEVIEDVQPEVNEIGYTEIGQLE